MKARPYKIIRSDRKTVSLSVRGGELIVRAPRSTNKRELDRIVAANEKWISGKLAAISIREKKREEFVLGYGSLIPYRGKPYPIEPIPSLRVGFDEKRFYIPQGLPAEQIRQACVQIYRLLAKRDLTNKVLDLAPRVSVMPIAVKINAANGRWGSCSAKKSLNFTWRLIMADDELIDYVVVHELAHIKEMNHSERFWEIVCSVIPDYNERRQRLKDFQKKLASENWE